MVSRAIVCGLLLFAPLLYAQDNALDRPASDFTSSGLCLTETLLKFSHQQNLRIAIEYVDRDSMEQPIAVNLQGGTVLQALDAILRNGRGYRWQSQYGIIEITNKRLSERAEKQLNTVIPIFEISAAESPKMASAMLRWNLQRKLDPRVKGFAGSIMGDTESSKVKPATLRNRTVREILAYIVLNSRAEGWIVAGPPACLGFTPYCGLWFLVETTPSSPAYHPLLDLIRENL